MSVPLKNHSSTPSFRSGCFLAFSSSPTTYINNDVLHRQPTPKSDSLRESTRTMNSDLEISESLKGSNMSSALPDELDEDHELMNETFMAIDVKEREIGCCYYTACNETMYFMEGIKMGGPDIIDSRKNPISCYAWLNLTFE